MSCRKWEIQILRRSEGGFDQNGEANLMHHLERCESCRTISAKFSEVDDLFSQCRDPSLPPFLKEKIVSTVSEAIREDSTRRAFSGLFSYLSALRPGIAAVLLVLGIGLGLSTGWSLAQSMSGPATVSSHDLLSLAGFEGSETGLSLEFIWTDSNERIRQ